MNHKDTKTQSEPIPAEVDDVSREVVDAIYSIHTTLGPGLLESVYEFCLAHELAKRDLKVDRQGALPVYYGGVRLDAGLRLDLLIENCLVFELKAVEKLLPVHKAHILTYLKLSHHRLGLLVNFNVPLIKDGIVRVVL